MKKTHNFFLLFKPDRNFQKLLPALKIVIFLLICGMAFPAYSLAPGNPFADEQQQVRVTGKVTDASTGEVMAGVNLVVKGTSLGAITDTEGKYIITVPDGNASLVLSFIGYVTQEVPLNGRTTVDVALVSELLGLEGVVVIGYGTTKRATLTGSVSAVSGEDLKQSPVTKLTNSLIGRLPGLTSQQRR